MRYLRVMTPLLIFGCVIETLEETFCPEDSELTGSGECKCRPTCPPPPSNDCFYKTSTASIGTPGNCCPRYECNIPAGGNRDACPEDSIPIENGGCKCLPTCPPHKCHSGLRPVLIREALPETPGSCCPLYDCKPSESISWVGPEDGQDPRICIHEGISRKPNEKWQDSPCINCSCDEEGRVSCQETMCKSCENPIPPEAGECCPHCPMPPPPQINATHHELPPLTPPCRFDARECKLNCPHGYIHDKHDCPTCQCIHSKNIETNNDSDCPELSHCNLNCILAKDEGGCPVCDCQSTSILPPHETDKEKEDKDKPTKGCGEVHCDLHCEHGLAMDENDCTLCECKTSECPPLTGCRKRCNLGYKTNRKGCPICRCRVGCTDDLNVTHPEGETWHPNSCKTCTCEVGGKLNCKETVCSLACTDPLPPKPNTCCQICPIMNNKETNTTHQHQIPRGWGTIPITLIVVLTFLCLLLIVHIVRSRFRGRLSPSETAYSSYPPQYYKCVPAYDTPMHHNEKIVRL